MPGMECRLGVLALGDSITNGGGELQWGVALQSWALWTARGLALPYTGWAIDGARAADVVRAQIPLVPAAARYDLGCLYVGVNDVRTPDWDAPPSRATPGPRATSCARAAIACWPARSRAISAARAPAGRWTRPTR